MAETQEEMEYLTEGDEIMYVQDFLEDEETALLARSRDKSLISQGEELGIKKGRKDSLIETAKKMLKAKEDVNKIQNYTDLTIEEINNLKKKL